MTETIDIPINFNKAHPKKTPLQLDLDWRRFLLLNIKVKPSSLFIEDTSGKNPDDDDYEAPEDIEFDWHSKGGLASNIKLVLSEFCEARGLKPFKIAVVGKPCTGKTHFAK